MWDLFKAELIRFRIWAFAAAAVHLLALGFMARVVDLAQQPLVVQWVVGGTYALAGLLLGLYQMGSYRRPSQWLNLLHRPLAHRRIAASLACSAGVLLAIAVALPILLVALWQETATARVVDLRHWLLPLSGWLIATSAYLAGAFCSLRGVRSAGAALVLLCWPLASDAYGPGLIAVELIVLASLAGLLLLAFRPDPTALPRAPGAVLAIALPLSMANYLLLLIAFMSLEMLWIAQGSHPNNTPVPPAGGHNEVEKMDERGRMLAGLQGSVHPDAPLLREQIGLSEPHGFGVQVPKLPQRQELANFRPMEFDDAKGGIRWVFSHDDMRLHGWKLRDRRAAGTLGVGADNAPFPAPVLPGGPLPGMSEDDAVLVGGRTLYQYVAQSQQVVPRLVLPAGETLMGVSLVGARLAALSDRALYFLDARDMAQDLHPVPIRLRVALPGAMGDLRSLEAIELVDGWLVAFTFSARSHTVDGVAPFQATLRVHDDGRIETIHRRPLVFDYPAAYRYRAWWPSPALHALGKAALELFAPPLPLDATTPAPIPRSVIWRAILLAALSATVAWLRGARTATGPRGRMTWTLACAVGGPPVLATWWLMVPLRDPLDRSLPDAAAIATA